VPRAGGFYIGEVDGCTLYLGQIARRQLSWHEADAWCRSLTVGSHSDFRLPTISEFAQMAAALPTVFGSTSHFWCADTVPVLNTTDVMHFDLLTGEIQWGRWCADAVPNLEDAMSFDLLTGPIHWERRFALFTCAVRRQQINGVNT